MRPIASDVGGLRAQDFFQETSEGSQKYRPNAYYADLCLGLLRQLPESIKPTGLRYFREMSHFGRHIGASVPDYDRLQIVTAHALTQAFSEGGGAKGLIIGGSDGRFGRTVSAQTKGRIETVTLTPEISNARVFWENTHIPGASFALGAYTYGEGRIIDGKRYGRASQFINVGSLVKYVRAAYTGCLCAYDLYGPVGEDTRIEAASENYQGDAPYDFVTGHVAFQFLYPKDRIMQMQRMKQVLAPGGLMIVSEKHLSEPGKEADYWTRELWKDAYKATTFTACQNKDKEARVLRDGAGQDKMEDRQSTRSEFQAAAQACFKVAPRRIWNAGNFDAYALSDNEGLLDRFCEHLPPMVNSHTAEPLWNMSTYRHDFTSSSR